MNKENVQAALDDLKVRQDLFLISKLEKEYRELSDKCNKLYKFIYSLDFDDKVRNDDEKILLQEQHKRMEAYRTNLYQRIQFYRNLITVNNGLNIFTPWCKVVEKIHQEAVESDTHHCGQDASCQVGDGSAVVNEIPDSIKSLVGMLVVDAFHDTHKCTGCEYQERCNAKKVELVGGYFLCLEELPNSLITE